MSDLLVERLAAPPSVTAALARFSGWPQVTLFHSALVREGQGRFSFLTADPLVVSVLDQQGDALCSRWSVAPQLPASTRQRLLGELEAADRGPTGLSGEVHTSAERKSHADAVLAPLRRLLSVLQTGSDPNLPPFQGGVAGLICYEAGMLWERLPAARYREDWRHPLWQVGVFDWVLAWDHADGAAWLIVQPLPQIRRPEEAAGRFERLKSHLQQPPSGLGIDVQTLEKTSAPRFPLGRVPGLESNFGRESYLAAVQRTIRYIQAGDIFQANLSQRLSIPASGSPVSLYEQLTSVNPAPFAAYFDGGQFQVISASPERFLKLDGDEVETRPIKGTRARRTIPEADLFTRDELRESDKDRAENVMIVDLLRNDLSRVCRPGSIRVPQLCTVETYETVQHLVSEVRGRLQPGKDFFDLLGATFPGGSITGAPKIRAMEIITELEEVPRGPYCGSLFYLGYDGRADSSILIRTFTQSGGWLRFPVGGGITAESDPASEYEETLHKAEGLLRALELLR